MAYGTNNSRKPPDEQNRLYTLYFIRHAEALHNRLEKRAMAEALALALAQGHRPDSAHAKRVQEEARRAVLEGNNMGDPPLSEVGLEEAKKAKWALEQLIRTYHLPKVEEVWVSPLQRTMQTADVIFPDTTSPHASFNGGVSASTSIVGSPVIRVKKEIEERHTGLACDQHSPFTKIRQRSRFKRFSLSCLMMEKLIVKDELQGCESFVSSESIGLDIASGHGSFWEDKEVAEPPTRSNSSKSKMRSEKQLQAKSAIDRGDLPDIIEDKAMLRERTKKLFNLLAETECRSICLIGHKGYLRELERGPLGKTNAELFKNCEVRVYRLELDIGSSEATDDLHSIIECDCESGVRDGAHGTDGRRRERKPSIDNPILHRAERIVSSAECQWVRAKQETFI